MTKKIIFKTKAKSAFADKTKARKKKLEHHVAVTAIAATSSKLLPGMKLELRSINSLKGLKRRARKSASEQVERVARSLRMHKQAAPILIDACGEIINGHIVAEAMKSLGEHEAWCVVIDHLGENEREMLHVALNRISECGDWDLEVLGPLLVDLGEIGFELEATGFTLPELDIIMALNSPEFSRRPWCSSSAAVRTLRVTASCFSHACVSGCRTSRCNRTHPVWPRRVSDRSGAGRVRV